MVTREVSGRVNFCKRRHYSSNGSSIHDRMSYGAYFHSRSVIIYVHLHETEGYIMIVVRNVFRLKFGKAKEGVELWKEGTALAKRLGFKAKSGRVMTDLVGQFYTIVFETTFESLGDFENAAKTV